MFSKMALKLKNLAHIIWHGVIARASYVCTYQHEGNDTPPLVARKTTNLWFAISFQDLQYRNLENTMFCSRG